MAENKNPDIPEELAEMLKEYQKIMGIKDAKFAENFPDELAELMKQYHTEMSVKDFLFAEALENLSKEELEKILAIPGDELISPDASSEDSHIADALDELDKKEAEKNWEELDKKETERRQLNARTAVLRARRDALLEKSKEGELSEEEQIELEKILIELKEIRLKLKELPTLKEIKLSRSKIKQKYKGVFKPDKENKIAEKRKEAKEKDSKESTKKETSKEDKRIVTDVTPAPKQNDITSVTPPAPHPIPVSNDIGEYNNAYLKERIQEFEQSGKMRGASGIAFNYIMPTLDKKGRVVDCEFYTDTLTKTRYKLFHFANSPLRAYQVVLNEKFRMIEKMQILKPEDNINLKEHKKKLLENFKNDLAAGKSDLCTEKMIAIRTAITREEIKEVLENNMYPLDKYEVNGSTSNEAKLFPPHFNKDFNQSFTFHIGFQKTVAELHPESKPAKDNTRMRIRRMDRRNNRNTLIKRIRRHRKIKSQSHDNER
ncbi:MAG: hypothetical protein IJ217_01720 [Clostridia bacterium]|nr:hypothetical protein [Clostridia bacterium]